MFSGGDPMRNGLLFYEVRNVKDLKDREGRPLGEHQASEAARVGTVMKLKQCPYPGTRHAHPKPMNTSALQQVSAHWHEALCGLRSLRAMYLATRRKRLSTTFDYLQLGSTVAAVPAYVSYRVEQPVGHGELSGVVATMYKLVIGVNRTLMLLVSGELMAGGADNQLEMSHADIGEFAETTAMLIGPKEVCAGTPQQIQSFIGALIRDDYETDVDTMRAVDAELQTLVQPQPAFFRFTEAVLAMECMDFLFKLVSSRALADLEALLQASRTTIPCAATDRLHASVTEALEKVDAFGTFRRLTGSNKARTDRLLDGWARRISKAKRPATLADGDAESVARTCALLAERPVGGQLPPALLRDIAGVVRSSVRFEQYVLGVLTEIQERLNAALGRAAVPRPLDGNDLVTAFEVTLGRLIADAFELEIATTPQSTEIRSASGSVSIAGAT
jgi:hypothetical protein